MTVIDFHNHIVPADFPDDPTGGNISRWPSMRTDEPGKASVMIGGKVYRVIDDRCWDGPAKIAGMDEDGVDLQVLSPMPELLSYWFEPDQTILMGRHMAEAMARLKSDNPGRFEGLGMVPLQNPAAAAEELGVLKREFGLTGVEIGSHVLGTSLGDESLDVFFEAAVSLDMVVFVHALQPIGHERWGTRPINGALIGYPIETAMAVASIVEAGIIRKYPDLKLVIAHGGGALAGVLARLDHAWSINPRMQEKQPERPLDTARRFYYDTVVFDPEMLRYLVRQFGPDRLLLGTDFPFAMRQKRPGDFVRDALEDKDDAGPILGGVASRLLGL